MTPPFTPRERLFLTMDPESLLCSLLGILPRPSIWAEPASVVPWGQPVTVRCRSPAEAETFHLEKEGSPWYQGMRSPARGTEAGFPISAANEDTAGLYRCFYYRSFTWSESSEALELAVTGQDASLLAPSSLPPCPPPRRPPPQPSGSLSASAHMTLCLPPQCGYPEPWPHLDAMIAWTLSPVWGGHGAGSWGVGFQRRGVQRTPRVCVPFHAGWCRTVLATGPGPAGPQGMWPLCCGPSSTGPVTPSTGS